MHEKQNELKKLLKNLTNQKITRASLSSGSFFTLDFGKDLEISVQTNQGTQTFVRGEWEISVYMAFWKFEHHGILFFDCDDKRETIVESLKKIENKKLLNFNILSDQFDTVFRFEDEIDLYLMANNEEDDNEQWMLFTPDGKTLVAGPGSSLTVEEE